MRTLLALLLAGAACAEEHRRLFLDALLVERQSGLERRFHALRKHPGNPLLVAGQPCEEGSSGPYLYGTVLDEGGTLRMWYHYLRKGYRNGYAESSDGLRWTKRDCSALAELDACHNPAVIRLPDDSRAPNKYALFCFGADVSKVRAAFSPDGLDWTFVPETAKQGLFDSSDVVNFFYDPYGKQFAATWKGPTRRGRSVGIALSRDGLAWTKPLDAPIFTADDLDPPDTQIYGMPVFPYQGVYVGLPWIYHAASHYTPEMRMTRAEAEALSPRTVDVQLAWSWDLLHWSRPPERKPFLALGAAGAFDSKMVFTARAPVERNGELYFYYGGFPLPHDARQTGGAIGLATLRQDGFCSMHAGGREGWLITRREALAAPMVTINAVTANDGEIRAELLDAGGSVLPGFSREESIPFRGDAVSHVLRWRTQQFDPADRAAVKKIRFLLRGADLYSYVP
ncbi:MAG: hypothetical protein JNK48_05975 [Bryobacterales bacterium]|nr:hypothetical protein [Bryobacterales bacterium]